MLLQLQITIGSNFADYVAGFIDKRDNQPVRRAASERYVDVAEIVGFW